MNNEELRNAIELFSDRFSILLSLSPHKIALGIIKGYINKKKRIRKMNHERIKKKNKHMAIHKKH